MNQAEIVINIFIISSVIHFATFKGCTNYTFRSFFNISTYGKDWMYFPDGDGVLHYINLTDSIVPMPSLRMQHDIEFRLYPQKKMGNYLVLDEFGGPSSKNNFSQILPNTPTKVITHGWMSSADKSGVINIVEAYLRAQNVNVIAVDWSSYSMNIMYPAVAYETKEVGSRIATFLDLLTSQYSIPGEQMHLIGHSLGAHVMGVAGFKSKYKIGRITGLDPALPTFKNIQEDKTRLDYNDATFVDVIHTCGGVLGFWDAIGKADFYPNKGIAPQPGCESFNLFEFDACSHGRSHIYFAESIINPRAFPSFRCKNNAWNYNMKNCRLSGFMGEYINWDMTGIFHLKTNAKEPFGKGRK